MPRKMSCEGKTFGRLTVFAKCSKRGPSNSVYWLCKCSCGGSARVTTHMLVHGKVRSCGCLFTEMIVKRNTTHGLCAVPEYKVWRSMHDRCGNPNKAEYVNYGGRGIKVCDRWQSFKNFYADMGSRPSSKHTIERINNDGNYEPGNCVWADRSTQCLNRRRFKNNKSGHTGVLTYTDKTGNTLYRASAQRNGIKVFLGSFTSLDDALAARNSFFNTKETHHGNCTP